MSDAFDRGKAFELEVAKLLRKADPDAKRDTRSGANWHRRSDEFTRLPIHVECKNHETLKPKEWYRQARDAASIGHTPLVAFPVDGEPMTLLRLGDLVNLFVEIKDLREELKDLKEPIAHTTSESKLAIRVAKTTKDTQERLEHVSETMAVQKCREGHIADEYGKCMIKGCKLSRGYRAPKSKATTESRLTRE